MSNISGLRYHIASAIGLLPAQLINVYLGSSLRSMQDVLQDKSTAATGYIVFCFQVCAEKFEILYWKIIIKFANLLKCTLDNYWSVTDGLRSAESAPRTSPCASGS